VSISDSRPDDKNWNRPYRKIEPTEPFVMVPKSLLGIANNPLIGPAHAGNALVVLGTLGMASRNHPTVRMSLRQIAEETGFDPQAIRRTISRLEQAGVLSVATGGGGSPSEYTLRWLDDPAYRADTPITGDTPTPITHDTPTPITGDTPFRRKSLACKATSRGTKVKVKEEGNKTKIGDRESELISLIQPQPLAKEPDVPVVKVQAELPTPRLPESVHVRQTPQERPTVIQPSPEAAEPTMSPEAAREAQRAADRRGRIAVATTMMTARHRQVFETLEGDDRDYVERLLANGAHHKAEYEIELILTERQEQGDHQADECEAIEAAEQVADTPAAVDVIEAPKPVDDAPRVELARLVERAKQVAYQSGDPHKIEAVRHVADLAQTNGPHARSSAKQLATIVGQAADRERLQSRREQELDAIRAVLADPKTPDRVRQAVDHLIGLGEGSSKQDAERGANLFIQDLNDHGNSRCYHSMIKAVICEGVDSLALAGAYVHALKPEIASAGKWAIARYFELGGRMSHRKGTPRPIGGD